MSVDILKVTKGQAAQRRALLLCAIGDEAYRVYENLPTLVKDENEDDYDVTIRQLRNHYEPKTNVIVERFQFRQRGQQSHESTADYAAVLHGLAKKCNFGAMEDELIRDQIVEKTPHNALRQRLLQEHDLTLPKLLGMAESHEQALQQAATIQHGRAKQLFKGVSYEPTSANLYGFGHNPIQVHGTLPAIISYNERKVNASFYLVDTPEVEKLPIPPTARITVNMQKSVFSQPEVDFCGHRLTKHGVAPLQSAIRAVVDAPHPTDLKELRSFIGTTAWFSRFIPAYSTVVQPLTVMLKEDVPFEWGPAAEHAFNSVKSLISSSPVMMPFSPALDTIVTTNASDRGAGAVLTQIQADGQERPVVYCDDVVALVTDAAADVLTEEDIRAASAADPVMEKLRSTIRFGWPDTARKCAPDLRDYFAVRHELQCREDGIVMRGPERVVVPETLRSRLRWRALLSKGSSGGPRWRALHIKGDGRGGGRLRWRALPRSSGGRGGGPHWRTLISRCDGRGGGRLRWRALLCSSGGRGGGPHWRTLFSRGDGRGGGRLRWRALLCSSGGRGGGLRWRALLS
ncbi:Transposon Tf2-9 polyprotein [Amphibalanus amphitrite]|uniref:RNA-directed DNA polymerase n=1 Tax=Amphibalanus amphitrite TaxID=1232801 RepID=A0A6A4WMT1_AMPAM|nr:Transposon Tf2-9 polyprotein [Amphibalanus amphitrite]